MVDQLLVEPGLTRDLVDPRAHEAVGGELGAGGVQQQPARGVPIASARPHQVEASRHRSLPYQPSGCLIIDEVGRDGQCFPARTREGPMAKTAGLAVLALALGLLLPAAAWAD